MRMVVLEARLDSWLSAQALQGLWIAIRSTDNLEIVTYEYHTENTLPFLPPITYYFKRYSPKLFVCFPLPFPYQTHSCSNFDGTSCSFVLGKPTDFLSPATMKFRWIYKDRLEPPLSHAFILKSDPFQHQRTRG